MVCGVFEEYLRGCRIPGLDLSMFRLLLCLHDIGKPRALVEGQKHLQHTYTAARLGELRELLPVSTSDLATMQALVSDDALGLLIRGKISHNESVQRISAMADRVPTAETCEFFGLLTLLYQCDAGAYTRAGFRLPASDFVAKPKLEHTFRQTENGLVFSAVLNRLVFSAEIEPLYLALRSEFCSETDGEGGATWMTR
jgi:hypothetical protein